MVGIHDITRRRLRYDERHNFKNGYFRMPLKRTYSTSTSIVPTGYQQTKKRRMPLRKRARKYPAAGTVGKPMPFPIRMVATLKYCETLSMLSSLTPLANINIAANSIYDPNLSGTGHQPYGHDVYSGIYNQYTVLKSRCRFKVGATSNSFFTWGGGIEDTVGTTAAVDTWAERPTYKSRIQNQMGSPECLPIVLYWDRNKRFPHNDTYRDLSAAFGTNPSEIEIFNIVAQTNSGTGTLGQLYCTVEVEYIVEMYEIKDLGDS